MSSNPKKLKTTDPRTAAKYREILDRILPSMKPVKVPTSLRASR